MEVETVACDDQTSLLSSGEVRRGRATVLPWLCACSVLAVVFGSQIAWKSTAVSSSAKSPLLGLWWVGSAERDPEYVASVHQSRQSAAAGAGAEAGAEAVPPSTSATPAGASTSAAPASAAAPIGTTATGPCSSFEAHQVTERAQCLQQQCTSTISGVDSTNQKKMSNCLVDQCNGDVKCLRNVCILSQLLSPGACQAARRDCSVYVAGDAKKYECLRSKCAQETDQERKSICLVDQCALDSSDPDCLGKVCTDLTDPSLCLQGKRKCSVYGVDEPAMRRECMQHNCAKEADDSEGLVNCLIDQCEGKVVGCLAAGANSVCSDSPAGRLPAGGKQPDCQAGTPQCSSTLFPQAADRYACRAKTCTQEDVREKSNCLLHLCDSAPSGDTVCLPAVCAGLTDSDKCLKGEHDCSFATSTAAVKTCRQQACAKYGDNDETLANCLIDQCAGSRDANCRTQVCAFGAGGVNAPTRLPTQLTGPVDNPKFVNCNAGDKMCTSAVYTALEDRYSCYETGCSRFSDKTKKANCLAAQCLLGEDNTEACRTRVCEQVDSGVQSSCTQGVLDCIVESGDQRYQCIKASCSTESGTAKQRNCVVDRCELEGGNAAACRTAACSLFSGAVQTECGNGWKECAIVTPDADQYACQLAKCSSNVAPYTTDAKANNCVVEFCKALGGSKSTACLNDICGTNIAIMKAGALGAGNTQCAAGTLL